MLALPLVKELLLVAREGVVGAVVVVRLDHVEGLRADLDLRRVLVELAVELVRVRLRAGLDVRAQVRAHEVVRVALELGRHVLGEEGDLRVVRVRSRVGSYVTLGEGLGYVRVRVRLSAALSTPIVLTVAWKSVAGSVGKVSV